MGASLFYLIVTGERENEIVESLEIYKQLCLPNTIGREVNG